VQANILHSKVNQKAAKAIVDHWQRVGCKEAQVIHSVATRELKRKFSSAPHVCQQCGHKVQQKVSRPRLSLAGDEDLPCLGGVRPKSPGCNKTYWDEEA
jgi:uncharacterized protein with PIN domain